MPEIHFNTEKIKRYAYLFKKHLEDRGRNIFEDRESRKKEFPEIFSEDKISGIASLDDFKKIIKDNFWCEKNLIRHERKWREVGLFKIKEDIKELIYGELPVEERINNFVNSRSGLGISFATEVLHNIYPHQVVLVNNRIKDFEKDVLGHTYDEYVKHKEFADKIRNTLKEFGLDFKDYTELDYFFYYIHENLFKEKSSANSSHFENITHLLRNKKQLIFYGPPGTGKTYNAKKFAVEFIENSGG